LWAVPEFSTTGAEDRAVVADVLVSLAVAIG